MRAHPELEGCAHVPEDIQDHVTFKSGAQIDMEMLDLFYYVGLEAVFATKAKLTNDYYEPIPFHMEIISNLPDRNEELLGDWDILTILARSPSLLKWWEYVT